MSGPRRFSPEQKARAVRMVLEGQSEYPSQSAAIESVAAKVGVSSETLRKWVRRAEIDGGQRAGLTTEEAAEIKRLKRENVELRRANGRSHADRPPRHHRRRCYERTIERG